MSHERKGMDIGFYSTEQDIKDWADGSLSELVKKEATGYWINFEYDNDDPHETNFNNTICFMELAISDGLLKLTRPMNYSEIVALRDYLNIMLSAHKYTHHQRINYDES